MGYQEELDRCCTFREAIADALHRVRMDWTSVYEPEMRVLAQVPYEDREEYLANLRYGFSDARCPNGLDAKQSKAWSKECQLIERQAHEEIKKRTHAIDLQAGRRAYWKDMASINLATADAKSKAGDTLDGTWLVCAVQGVYLGHIAGGEEAFDDATDRGLFASMTSFVADNAERILAILAASPDRPSDAEGVQRWRGALELVAQLAEDRMVTRMIERAKDK